MTEQDLHLNYKQDTGKDACSKLSDCFYYLDDKNMPEIQDYIDWLEQKVLLLTKIKQDELRR